MLTAVLVTWALIAFFSAVVCWFAAASSSLGPSRRRRLQLRREHLREHPEQVTAYDVELLLADTLPADRAADVCRAAVDRGVPALVLWTWVQLYDAELLALAVEAGLTPEELLHHVGTGTPPDRRSLEIFAAFRGAVAS